MLKAAPMALRACRTVRSAASRGTALVHVSPSMTIALSCVRTAEVLLLTIKSSGPARCQKTAFSLGTCIFLVALHVLHSYPPTVKRSKAEVCHPSGIHYCLGLNDEH